MGSRVGGLWLHDCVTVQKDLSGPKLGAGVGVTSVVDRPLSSALKAQCRKQAVTMQTLEKQRGCGSWEARWSQSSLGSEDLP
jgi:hypothetical protein